MTSKAKPGLRAGLIGSGIQASASPAMHMEEGAQLGLDYDYRLYDLDHIEGGSVALAALLTDLQGQGLAGLNITHPCKQAVIPLLDALSDDAAALGAVNTVVFEAGRRVGYNTDWSGFAENLRRGLPGAALHRVAQFGAGGAGAAVAYALLKLGAKELNLFDTDPVRADVLAKSLVAQFPGRRIGKAADAAAAVRSAEGLVNCTPIGMAKYPGMPVAAELLRPEMWVAEIVYFPLETELLRTAGVRGCATLDGGGMAVFQAAEAIRLITGLQPDAERMLARFAERTRTAPLAEGANE